ncbi:hypothetical protein IFR05_003782 [Cadophora sp. M221]|nr:hypothetical protein IFR05_003782 [Cadophora sp. M221]
MFKQTRLNFVSIFLILLTSSYGSVIVKSESNSFIAERQDEAAAARMITLQQYASDSFNIALIQPDDDLAATYYMQNWSPDVKEYYNGNLLTFHTFYDFLVQIRNTTSNRAVVPGSESIIAAPADAAGLTGTVGHSVQFSGVSNGVTSLGTVVTVVNVGRNVTTGERNVLMGSFCLTFQ